MGIGSIFMWRQLPAEAEATAQALQTAQGNETEDGDMSLDGAGATMAPWEWSTEDIKREVTSCSEKGFKGP